MKPIWEVRNLNKLLNGLSATVAIFMLFYTVLTLIANPDIPSKFSLLRVPVMSIICTVALMFFEKSMKKSTTRTKEQIKLYTDLYVGANIAATVAYAFIQLGYLSTAKNIQGFSPIVAPALVIGLVVFCVYKFVKIRRV